MIFSNLNTEDKIKCITFAEDTFLPREYSFNPVEMHCTVPLKITFRKRKTTLSKRHQVLKVKTVSLGHAIGFHGSGHLPHCWSLTAEVLCVH